MPNYESNVNKCELLLVNNDDGDHLSKPSLETGFCEQRFKSGSKYEIYQNHFMYICFVFKFNQCGK